MNLRAHNITIFRDEWCVSGIEFGLNLGDVLVVGGGNGSGKTSLLRCLAGLLPMESGEIHSDPPLRDSFVYLGHTNALKPSLTVRQNLVFWAKFLGCPPSSVDESLERMNLRTLSDVMVSNLSSGQARCVALSRLLLSEHPYWFLDEPTTGLDESAESLVCGLIEEQRQRGIVIVATHRPLNLKTPKMLRLGGEL